MRLLIFTLLMSSSFLPAAEIVKIGSAADDAIVVVVEMEGNSIPSQEAADWQERRSGAGGGAVVIRLVRRARPGRRLSGDHAAPFLFAA